MISYKIIGQDNTSKEVGMGTRKDKGRIKRSERPLLSLVVPFPEDRVVRDREIENLIRRLRRAKEKGLSEVLVLGLWDDGSLYVTSNGVSKKDSLWLLEMVKLDIFGLLGPEEEV